MVGGLPADCNVWCVVIPAMTGSRGVMQSRPGFNVKLLQGDTSESRMHQPSWCLYVATESRPGRRLRCVACGFVHHVDCNAGYNSENRVSRFWDPNPALSGARLRYRLPMHGEEGSRKSGRKTGGAHPVKRQAWTGKSSVGWDARGSVLGDVQNVAVRGRRYGTNTDCNRTHGSYSTFGLRPDLASKTSNKCHFPEREARIPKPIVLRRQRPPF